MGKDKVHKKKKPNRKVQKRDIAKRKKEGKPEDGANKQPTSDAAARKQNPKAFVFSSRGKAKTQMARSAEKEQRRMHVPKVERETDEPPPFVVLVHGPPGVGKTTLIKCLIKHYTRQNIGEVKGPITLVSGKLRRLTFIECPQNLHSMIDASKYADLVLLMVDGAFGFEMETFEFLNLLQVQGFPKVMGVLTHLDSFKDAKRLKKTKKALKHRFWAEIYEGAKLFYLSGMRNGKYMKREVLNLARFISVMKFRPLNWRTSHPYLLADRFEDITPVERIRENPKCDREVTVFGYSRGTNLKPGANVHIAGVGDYTVQEMDAMPDPCPLPSMLKKRGLNEKERLLFAPMADVGGLLYDKDAVYITIPDWKVNFTGERPAETEGEAMVRQLQTGDHAVDRKLEESTIRLFDGGASLVGSAQQPGQAYEDDTSDAEDEDQGDLLGDEVGSEDADDDDAEEDGSPVPTNNRRQLESQILIENDGRVRRRAIFPSADADVSLDETDEETDEEDREDSQTVNGNSAIGDESEDSEGLGAAARWKRNLGQNAQSLFRNKAADLQALVYGKPTTDAQAVQRDDDDDDEGDLFRPRQTQDAERPVTDVDALDALDSSMVPAEFSRLQIWDEADAKESLRNRFVTGDWEQGKLRDAAAPGEDADDSDAELFADFEDLETGKKFNADGDAATAMAMKAIQDEARARTEDKAAKKAAFDMEYDVGGRMGVKDKPQKAKQGAAEEEEEEETYYDAMKKDMAGRAARTKSALDALDPQQRVAMEGFRPGTYLRLRFSGLPCELVQNFTPTQPLLIGGLSTVEEGRGFLQLRLKRHRWFPKVLKTRDPLTFSIGWRRFQSLPVYAIEDQNGRHRMLKYTPEHMHCVANIYGTLAPTNTGIIAIQSAAANQRGWRISATGVVTALDAAPKVVKKLKLTGTPVKIMKNTAFISGMFNSPLEVAKFEGAAIRTVSGLRGTIKKASNPGKQEGKAGTYRATFEDKPLMSDIVFLRAWVAVDLPRFYNPVTNLLGPSPVMRPSQQQLVDGEVQGQQSNQTPEAATSTFIPASAFAGAKPGYIFTTAAHGTGYYAATPAADLQHATDAAAIPEQTPSDSLAEPGGDGWVDMKTVAQLRRELGIGAPRNADSLYRPIERTPRKFNPLKIPKSLQAELPYQTKPKNMEKRKRPTLEQKRAVVLEPGEKKAVTLVQQLNALRNAKDLKRRAQQDRRRQEHAKKVAEVEAWRLQYNKEERKKRYVAAGQAEKTRNKRQRTA